MFRKMDGVSEIVLRRAYEFAVTLVDRRKETLDVAAVRLAQRAVGMVALEEIYLVL